MPAGVSRVSSDARTTRRAVVLVQDDLGRSPRMQYHAYALAVNGVAVDFVGFAGTPLPSAIREQEAIVAHAVSDLPTVDYGPFYTAAAALRAVRQMARLATVLSSIPEVDVVLVQTPPSLPSVMLAWLLARWRGARLVLDWHNLGWTLFAIKSGSIGVGLLRTIETWIGRRGDAHLCVSAALQAHLAKAVHCDARVLYDRAPQWFERPPQDRQVAVRRRMFAQSGVTDPGARLLVSPTSFTVDEDLHMLFDAADLLEGLRHVLPRGFPRLLVLATGAGEGRAAFEERAASRPRDALVVVRTAWVEPDEYPALLASADAGVCTHRSSSGLDLPMKVADMFGAGVPVLALAYPALTERVRDGENGMLFSNATSLARTWRSLFAPDTGAQRLAALRRASEAAGQERWLDGWKAEAASALI